MILTFIISLLIAGLTGNSSTPCDSVKIKDNLVSWGHKKVDLPRRIEAIIIHSSYNALTSDSFSVDGILEEYKRINVSPHYIIDRSGVIYRLVRDEEIAYHAGKSRLPDGKTDVNRVSIGIELINTETDPPTEAQYVSLVKLIACLKEKYPVKYVLGHSDIAPGRKTDPWDFDWQKLDAMLKSP
jgi:N-acetylmuramoyl-L-alanine amidase